MPASTRRTRSSGAPPGGHQQLDIVKRMRSSISLWPWTPTLSDKNPSYRDMSTQTDPDLTGVSATTPGKRARADDDDSANEHPSKRSQSTAVPQTEKKPFGFDRDRNRSALFSAPPKANGLYFSPRNRNYLTTPSRLNHTSSRNISTNRRSRIRNDTFDELPALRPTLEDTPQKRAETLDNRPQSADRIRQRQTSDPTPRTPPQQTTSASRSLMGSIRRLFWGEPAQPQTPAIQNADRTQTPSPGQQAPSHEDDDHQQSAVISRRAQQDHLFPPVHYTADEHHESPPLSIQGHRPTRSQAADDEGQDSQVFNPTPKQTSNLDEPGSRKRKLPSMNGFVPGPRSGGFGIDDSYLDQENQVDGIDETVLDTEPAVKTPPPKKRKLVDETPLQSAMKKSTSRFGTVPRSVNSVRFAPSNSTQLLTPHYGRAGDYRGSTFLEPGQVFDESSLSLVASDIISPTTQMNTLQNAASLIPVNPGVRDPYDANWRPSVANPLPGHFQLVYDDEEDDLQLSPEPSLFEQSSNTPQPSRPEPSPLQQNAPESQNTTNLDTATSSTAVEDNLSKERSKAQKYKPAKASRLSQSFEARPDGSPPTTTANLPTPSTISATPKAKLNMSTNTDIILKPQKPVELDNTIQCDDGMTDYAREHQYDDWASNLAWPQPQLYEDAGIGSEYMNKLIRDTWNENDSRRSHDFWQAEFERVSCMMDDARAQGRQFVMVSSE